MILSFLDKETEKVFHQEFSRKLPESIQKIALRKLILIDNALSINDLKVPPGNHLERLVGQYDGRWSIRINEQWRIIFIPAKGGADYLAVGIVDYH